ncbi:MAG: membrane protein [Chloroflexi bacterium]|nr:membrane protein [Chloroflexota bacterium]
MGVVNPPVSIGAGRAPASALVFAGRLALLMFGIVVFSFGNTLILQANVGLGPWHAFHWGLTLILPLTFGQASVAMSLLMLVASWGLGVRPGLGTVANGVLVGIFIDIFLGWKLVPRADSVLVGYLMLLAGILIFGLGSGIYIKPRFGAGPRDSFMLGMVRRTGWRVDVVRTTMEITVLIVGALLGGPIGGGTIVFSLTIGPVVRLCFRVFGIPLRPVPAPHLPARAATG